MSIPIRDPVHQVAALQISVIGAGQHACRHHLPALAECRLRRPGSIELAAVCDRDAERISDVGKEFGFKRVYSSLEGFLREERPDACLVLLPPELGAQIALSLARADIPVLVEKPPAATVTAAEELATAGRRLMVSMNRRFEPCRQAALEWIGSREITAARALMCRHRRTEPRFLTQTGLHLVDAVQSVLGEPRLWHGASRDVAGARWWQIRLSYASGAWSTIEIAPTAGAGAESFEFLGAGFRAEYCGGEFDRGGWRGWEDGRLVAEHSLPAGTPQFVANGTLAETEAFVAAVRGERAFSPCVADLLPAMRMCEKLEQGAV